MDSIKLVTDTREFFMSHEAREFDLVDRYLRDYGYRTVLSSNAIEEFRFYLEAKLDSFVRTFKESTRLKLSRIKQLNYRGKELELNLSDTDHFSIYWLHEMVSALATTKGLKIEYNQKA